MHNRLFKLDLFLQQVLNLLDVTDVVFVDVQILFFLPCPMLRLDLLHQISLIGDLYRLTSLLLLLLGYPMLLVSPDIVPELGCFIAAFHLVLILPLVYLLHEIVF